VGVLGHYLEEEGIPTTQISLVREHTLALNPPRALWVPFVLGRPFGAPNDSAFQRKVLLAALHLLERETGPVFEDFLEDAPHNDLGEVPAGLNCPVSFPRLKSEGTLAERLADEISQLRAWHDIAVKHRKRTTLGLTGLTPEEIGEFLGSWLTENPKPSFQSDIPSATALKLATDELKAFYYEAKAMQPGRHSVTEIQNWFWLETAAGKTFVELRNVAAKSPDPTMKGLATLSLVPRAVDAALKDGNSA
jgi:hypothetical protein